MARTPNPTNRAAIAKLAAARRATAQKKAVMQVRRPAPAGQAPKRIAKPAKPDDLTKISGVGGGLQKKVNEMGVWTYRQIAEWKGLEIAYVNGFLNFSGRIERDQWVRQAKQLMRDQIRAEEAAKKKAAKAEAAEARKKAMQMVNDIISHQMRCLLPLFPLSACRQPIQQRHDKRNFKGDPEELGNYVRDEFLRRHNGRYKPPDN